MCGSYHARKVPESTISTSYKINTITMSVFPKTPLIYLLAISLFLGFMSCDNEIAQDAISPDFTFEEEMPDLLIESLPPPDTEPDEMRRRPCFRFVFPIEVQLRNGTLIVAGDAEDLRAAYQQIIASRARANFVYPFDVELANGTTVSIENFLTLRRIHRACRDFNDDEEVTPCISINYPIQVIAGDSTLTINNGQELRRVDLAFRPRGVSIIYPIEVTHTESGRVVTLNGDRELFRLRRICNNRGDYDDRGLACYRLIFPIDVTINGNDRTFVSRIGWRIAVRNIPEDADVSIVYPVTIVNRESGEETLVASFEEWEAARALCD